MRRKFCFRGPAGAPPLVTLVHGAHRAGFAGPAFHDSILDNPRIRRVDVNYGGSSDTAHHTGKH